MNASIAKYSIALASVFALGMIGCGTSAPTPMAGPTVGGDVTVDPPTPPPSDPTSYPPVVKFTPFDPQTEAELLAPIDRGPWKGRSKVNYGYMIAKASPRLNPAKFEKYGMEVVGTINANGARYYWLHKDSDLVETMKKVRREMPSVIYIEPDLARYRTGDPVSFAWDKPDTLVASHQQYGVQVTQTMKAWQEFGFGGHRAVVSAIDSGVNFRHEDMTKTVRHAFTWFNAAGSSLMTSLTGNPYDDQDPTDALTATSGYITGTDFTNENNGGLHGTHTAGTMVAEGNNAKGVAGMCWNLDLVHYKCTQSNGNNYEWTIYGSLWHLAKWKNQRVDATGKPDSTGTPRYPYTIPVNISMGGPEPGQFEADMIEMALENDIMICAAAGNDYSGLPSWPCSYTGVMRVGATDFRDRRAEYSNWGPDMSVVAPGEAIYSVYGINNTSYVAWGGTSMASPHVAGLAGYMLTFDKTLKPDQIRTLIEQNCDPVDGQTGHSVHTGWGRINTYKTIAAVKAAARPSNYVQSPVRVFVEDPSGLPMDEVPVFLYKCDPTTKSIASYIGSTLTGYSYVNVRQDPVDEDKDGEEGVAIFNHLTPGFYKAVAAPKILDPGTVKYVPVAKSTPVFEIKAGVEPQEFTLKLEGLNLLFIQSIRTSATGTPADVVLYLYNAQTGDEVLKVDDYTTFETMIVAKPTKPGTYWIRVEPYGTTNNNRAYGEYALWVGTTYNDAWPAPGTVAAPGADGVAGGTSSSRNNSSQLVEIDSGKLIYAALANNNNNRNHYYRFVVPTPAP